MLLELGANSSDADFNKLEDLLEQDAIVWNHASWCGHCVNMKDEWSSLRSDLRQRKDVNVVSIESKALENKKIQNNITLYEKLTKKENEERVSYFPMVIVFVRDGNHVYKKIHEGDRIKDAMKETLESFKTLKKKAKTPKTKGSPKASSTHKGGESLKMTVDNFVNNFFKL